MKKSFLFTLAATAALFVSCSNDETVEVAKSHNAIEFKGFVNHSTRATDLTAANLEGFKIWGIMKKDGNIGKPFLAKNIAKQAGVWTYSPPVYWETGYTYSFTALAPNDANYTYEAPEDYQQWGKVSYDNTQMKDLMFAANDFGEITAGACPVPVNLTFNHILSRARFKFTNGMNDGSIVKVTDIKITNAPTKGVCTLAAALGDISWTTTDPALLDFGNITYQVSEICGMTSHKYMLPSTQSYQVTFKVTRQHNGVTDVYNHTITMSPVTMQPGKSYQFAAELNAANINPNEELCEIKFDISVNGWENYNDETLL